MSYILDALRKADAQRERDPARGIHAQPLRATTGGGRPRGGYAPWFWGASLAGVAMVAWGAWFLYQGKGAVPAAPTARPQVAAPAAPAPIPAPVAAVVGTAVQPAPAVAPAAVPLPARDLRMTSQPAMRGGPQRPTVIAQAPGAVPTPPATGTPPVATPAPARPSTAPVAPAPAPTSPTAPAPSPAAPPIPQTQAVPAAPPTPAGPSGPSTSAAAAAAAAPAAQPVAGLPPDAPKLAISGGVYSSNPAQRMLIVNGQVFNEGSEVGTGVVLEQIKPKGAVLKFRGARYTVAY